MSESVFSNPTDQLVYATHILDNKYNQDKVKGEIDRCINEGADIKVAIAKNYALLQKVPEITKYLTSRLHEQTGPVKALIILLSLRMFEHIDSNPVFENIKISLNQQYAENTGTVSEITRLLYPFNRPNYKDAVKIAKYIKDFDKEFVSQILSKYGRSKVFIENTIEEMEFVLEGKNETNELYTALREPDCDKALTLLRSGQYMIDGKVLQLASRIEGRDIEYLGDLLKYICDQGYTDYVLNETGQTFLDTIMHRVSVNGITITEEYLIGNNLPEYQFGIESSNDPIYKLLKKEKDCKIIDSNNTNIFITFGRFLSFVNVHAILRTLQKKSDDVKFFVSDIDTFIQCRNDILQNIDAIVMPGSSIPFHPLTTNYDRFHKKDMAFNKEHHRMYTSIIDLLSDENCIKLGIDDGAQYIALDNDEALVHASLEGRYKETVTITNDSPGFDWYRCLDTSQQEEDLQQIQFAVNALPYYEVYASDLGRMQTIGKFSDGIASSFIYINGSNIQIGINYDIKYANKHDKCFLDNFIQSARQHHDQRLEEKENEILGHNEVDNDDL